LGTIVSQKVTRVTSQPLLQYGLLVYCVFKFWHCMHWW